MHCVGPCVLSHAVVGMVTMRCSLVMGCCHGNWAEVDGVLLQWIIKTGKRVEMNEGSLHRWLMYVFLLNLVLDCLMSQCHFLVTRLVSVSLSSAIHGGFLLQSIYHHHDHDHYQVKHSEMYLCCVCVSLHSLEIHSFYVNVFLFLIHFSCVCGERVQNTACHLLWVCFQCHMVYDGDDVISCLVLC